MSKIPQSFKNLEGEADIEQDDHKNSLSGNKRRNGIFVPPNSKALEEHLFKIQNESGTQPSLNSINSVASSDKIL